MPATPSRPPAANARPSWLDRPAWVALAGVVLCVAVGLHRGQEIQWDLLNYHRYVAWAWTHERLARDFAPAGLQSYFNPALDLPMQWLWQHASARSAGALLCAWHGLALLGVWAVARRVLPGWSAPARALLALAGIVAPAFWGGLGMTTGDDASAVFVIAAVWAAVRWLETDASALPRPGWGLLAGALGGLAVGLKLTNGCAVLALAGALVAVEYRRPGRALARLIWFGLAALAGALASGGWWHLAVWQQFGNPLFPQFGRLFPSPLANAVNVADTRFLPHSLLEFFMRPVLMVWDYHITSELGMRALLWPLWFAAGLAFLVRRALRAWREKPAEAARTPAQQLLLWYVALAVVLWTAIFGIYRYTVPFEALMPVALALMWPSNPGAPTLLQRGAVLAAALLAVAVTLAPNGTPDWGHTGWSHRVFQARTPFRVGGERPVVLMAGHPVAWVIPFMGTGPSYVGVATNFPAGAGTEAEIRRRLAAADRAYLLVDSGNGESVAAGEVALKSLHLVRDEPACQHERAAIGQQTFDFQICPIRPASAL